MASGRNHSAATSPEEKAIKTCYKNLVLCIKASLSDTLVELTPHNLISREQKRYISNSTHDEVTRATKIVDCILDKLAECTTQDGRMKIYERFTGSLVCAETVKKQLQEALEKERLHSPEETVIRNSRDKLASCIQQDPEDTMAKLTFHGLFSHELRRYMDNPIHSQDEKAQEIIDFILKKIAKCETSSKRAEVFRQFTASLPDPDEVIKKQLQDELKSGIQPLTSSIEDYIDEWEERYEKILLERGKLCEDVDSEFRRLNNLKSKLKQHRERVRRIKKEIEYISGRANRDEKKVQQQLDEVDNELQSLQIKKELEEIDRKFTQSMKYFEQKKKGMAKNKRDSGKN